MSNLYFIGFGPEWETRQTLPGLPGERWVGAVREADLLGRKAEACALVWLNEVGPCDVQRCQHAGTLTTPEGRNTLRLRLTLTQQGPVSEPHWALMLGGKNVLGTCRIAFGEKYLQNVASWLRKRKRVLRAEVNGNGIDLTLKRHFGGRDWNGKPVTIGMGKPARLNTNHPSLTARHLQTVAVPAEDVYAVEIGADIEPGNVFRVGTRVLTVTATDTVESILEYLAPGGELVVSAGTRVACSVEVGASVRPNTNAPTITATYQSTGGGFDKYKIAIGADVRAGNAYTVNGTVKVATALDTAVSIAAHFNSVGGLHQVSAGTPVSVGAAPGTALLPNTNAPTCMARKIAARGARTVSRWAVTVGADIRAGNVYRVGSAAGVPVEVTAQPGDTARDVASWLSLGTMGVRSPQNPFLLETESDAPPVLRAVVGTPLTSENIVGWQTDRDRLTTEETEEAQALYSIVMPCREGIWRLGLVDAATRDLLAVSNPFDVAGVHAAGASVDVAFADEPGAYGLTHGPHLVHRVRVWGGLSQDKPVTEETQVMDLNGSVRRSQTEIRKQTTLTTPQLEDWQHEALAVALKHRRLWVNGRAAFQPGEYELSDRAKGTDARQGRVTLEWTRDVKRNFDLMPAPGAVTLNLHDGCEGRLLAALRVVAVHGLTGRRVLLTEAVRLGLGPWWLKLEAPHPVDITVKQGLEYAVYRTRTGLLLKLWHDAAVSVYDVDPCTTARTLTAIDFSEDFTDDFS